jgi:CBS domain-containing protein
MTEKLARRGARILSEYAADFLETVLVRDAMSTKVVTLAASDRVESVRRWLASDVPALSHQGFPVMDGAGIAGVVTRRDLLGGPVRAETTVRDLVKRGPVVISDRSSLREAADRMASADIGRLPVVSEDEPGKLVGILTRSDILGAHRERLAADVPQRSLSVWRPRAGSASRSSA